MADDAIRLIAAQTIAPDIDIDIDTDIDSDLDIANQRFASRGGRR
ncbi:MAG: hypothetical protein AAGJ87_12290 [Pseudomonadota bacterium]